ncbi:macro domain-containing protein [Spirosoma sp. 209]|uniref:type II toxin-antitoxin system antitoxin DNA ADP-ribosyl glycohydrolase DarG n=1 Tax=Spirosoma sp. 209 TaxID=1955701 RepID=UPI00098D682F|nr:macro domain-containing protein [Spirosoma sp. 209]
MQITYKAGNLFSETVDALVNTVNTVGVMGKGVALQFKEKYPENYRLYKAACDRGDVRVGQMFITETGLVTPKYIINFPTKEHWKGFSKLSYIDEGLDNLVEAINRLQIRSIAMPPLGSGNGGLQWSIVKPLILKKIAVLPAVEFVIYEPSDAAYQTPRTRTKPAPALTTLRAIVLNGLLRYKELGYDLTLLEIQKIVYLLQRLGLDFGLTFERHKYGPYAHKLRYVLNDLDGHYLTGMKQNEARSFDVLQINPEKIGQIRDYIQENCTPEEIKAQQILHNLISGFESPLGMELLATIDMILTEQPEIRFDTDQLSQAVADWSDRKATLMKPDYIAVTVNRLKQFQDSLYVQNGAKG